MPDETTEAPEGERGANSPSPRRSLAALAERINPRDVGYGALIAVGALFIYLVYAGAHVTELTDPNAMDYAQLARNVARGQGFTTSFVRPLSLHRVRNISHHPDLVHAPLHPLWMALFFRLDGPSAKMAAWSCGVAYLLTLPLLYILAVRLFDRRIALLALALYAVNYLSLQYAVSGLEVSLAALLLTVTALAVQVHLGKGDQPSLVTAALCGAAAAMCFLVSYVYLVLLVPVLVAVVLRGGKRRWAEMGACLGAFVVVTAPWAIRNAQVAGSPLFTLQTAELVGNTITYKGQGLYRTFAEPPGALGFLASHPKEAWLKLRPLMLSMYDSIPNLGGPFLAGFFLAAIFMRLRDDRSLRDLRYVHYGWIVLVAGALCFLSADPRLLVPLSPLVVIVGAAAFLSLLDGLVEQLRGPKRQRQGLVWGIAALVALCWFPVVAMTVTLEPRSTEGTANVSQICAALGEQKIHPAFSDQPWTLAWYGDIDTIWLPQSVDDLHALEEAVGPVRYMVLSPLISRAGDEEGLAAWAQLYAAAMRGMNVPQERFVAADLLGERDDWVLFGRLPEGVAAEGPTGEAPAPQ